MLNKPTVLNIRLHTIIYPVKDFEIFFVDNIL